jgi:hypothetical protein
MGDCDVLNSLGAAHLPSEMAKWLKGQGQPFLAPLMIARDENEK